MSQMQYMKQNMMMQGQNNQIIIANSNTNSAAHSRRTSQKSGKSIGGQSQGKVNVAPNMLNKKLSSHQQQQFIQNSQ